MNELVSFFARIVPPLMALATFARAIVQQPEPFDHVAFERRLATASNAEAHEIVRTAFARWDLTTIMACIEPGATKLYFVAEYRACKDDELKTRVAEGMLRSETIFKPFPPLAVLRGGQGVEKAAFMEMIFPVISARLGNVGSSDDLISDAQLRLRVADQLAASLSKDSPKSPSLPPEQGILRQSPPSTIQPEVTAPPTAAPVTSQSPNALLAQDAAVASKRHAFTWPWIVGILTVIAISALMLKRRA